MKTYILKRPVYNSIDFPIGTIIKPINEQFYCFEVVEGDLIGKKGQIADGIVGWIADDTEENRILIQRCIEQEENLMKQVKQNSERLRDLTITDFKV
jgi:hypothetical protein